MKRPSTGIVVLNVFICIFLVLPILLVALFAQSRYYVTDGATYLFKSVVDTDDIAEEFIEDIFEYSLNIDYDDIDDDIKDDTKELIDDMFGGMVTYAFTGEGTAFDIDAFVDYFDKHSDDIEDMTGYELTDDDLDDLRDMLEEELDDFEDSFDDIYSEDTEFLKVFFAKETIIVPLAIVIIGLLIIFATFNVRLDKSLKYSGVTFIVSAVIMFCFSGILAAIFAAASEDVPEARDFFNMIVRNGIIVDVVVLAVGILFTIVGGAYRNKLKEEYGENFEPRPVMANAYNTYNNVSANPYPTPYNNSMANNVNQYGDQYNNNNNSYNNGYNNVSNSAGNPVNNAGAEINPYANIDNVNIYGNSVDPYSYNSDVNTEVNTDVPSFDNNDNYNNNNLL